MNTLQATPKLLTAKQLRSHLNISEATLIRHKKKGIIPFIEIGGTIRYDLEDVLNSLKGSKNR